MSLISLAWHSYYFDLDTDNMAAVPFGFSVGDLVAGVQLINKAAKALRTASGATAQYQQAILDLELTETVLRRVQGLTPETVSQETIQTAQLCGHACFSPLAVFLQKVQRLEPHLKLAHKTDKTGLNNVIRAGRKVQWAVSLEEDVAKLKASIGPVLECLNTLLLIESLRNDESTQKDTKQVMNHVAHILPLVENTASFVRSNVATQNQIKDLRQTMITASAELSDRANNTTTKDQADRLLSLMQNVQKNQSSGQATLLSLTQSNKRGKNELQRLSEQSNHILVSISERIDKLLVVTETATPEAKGTIAGDAIKSQRLPSEKSCQTMSTLATTHLQDLLATLQRGLFATIALLLWLTPAFKIWMRTLTTVSRSPTLLLDSNITFVDALDRQFSLPYQQFRYWPVVSAWLNCQFKDCPGSLRIAHQQFAIFREMQLSGRGLIIPTDAWENTVRPGQRVLMSMHHTRNRADRMAQQVCPSCGFVAQLVGKECTVWTKW